MVDIKPDEISAILKQQLSGLQTENELEDIGTVLQVGDGIARVYGLNSVKAGELVEFETGTQAIVLNLEEDNVGVVLLGQSEGIREGSRVRRTNRIASLKAGDGFLGRVVNPLGEPIDGKGPIKGDRYEMPLERKAPGVIFREPVSEPLQTGIKAIDAMIPIGRGQRELIIGDRQTGKTAIAIDTIINQKELWGTDEAVRCIYVGIGQKGSTIAQVVATLEKYGAMEYTTVVSAPASAPAPFQYIAPYAGAAIGANWMYKGQHALIVYDDLTKQADAYRQLSLLLRRPPGREAYPGDVFYLHSRLLERAAKLSEELGGGSMTALPIVETKANDVSAYIPTNVISITDGQIFLETDLFFQGVRPAMNAGISVSRVGGAAQRPAMKAVSGTVRLELAQFRELEAFAQFGSDLDKASQQQIARGQRVVEILKQPQYQPLPVERQVVSVVAVTSGRLDDLPVTDVRRYETELHNYVDARHPELLKRLRTEKLTDELRGLLDTALSEFHAGFVPSVVVETEEADDGWDAMSASSETVE